MKKNLDELIKIQKEIIEEFDEELFLLEEEYLEKFGAYPVIEHLNLIDKKPNKEDILKAKEEIRKLLNESEAEN